MTKHHKTIQNNTSQIFTGAYALIQITKVYYMTKQHKTVQIPLRLQYLKYTTAQIKTPNQSAEYYILKQNIAISTVFAHQKYYISKEITQ